MPKAETSARRRIKCAVESIRDLQDTKNRLVILNEAFFFFRFTNVFVIEDRRNNGR